MRIVLSNLAVCLGIYALYCWTVPEFFPGYRSYLPLLVGAVISFVVSYMGIIKLHPAERRLTSIAVSGLCALAVAGISLAAVIATRGT